jgi:hypothetical protein
MHSNCVRLSSERRGYLLESKYTEFLPKQLLSYVDYVIMNRYEG